MKKYAIAPLVALVLAGCSGSSDEPPPTNSVENTPPPGYEDDIEGGSEALDAEASANAEGATTEAGPSTSPRGFISVQVGETATGKGYSFTVDEIIPNFQCDETPENGGFLGVRLTVTTEPGMADMGFYISEQDFVVIGADGVQENSSSSVSANQCVPDSEEFPIGGPGPGVTIKALFVLDTPAVAGTLALDPLLPTPGWEWQF